MIQKLAQMTIILLFLVISDQNGCKSCTAEVQTPLGLKTGQDNLIEKL